MYFQGVSGGPVYLASPAAKSPQILTRSSVWSPVWSPGPQPMCWDSVGNLVHPRQGRLWPGVTTSPLNLSINEKRDPVIINKHGRILLSYTAPAIYGPKQWWVIFRLCEEREQACDMRRGGGVRHAHAASQARLRWGRATLFGRWNPFSHCLLNYWRPVKTNTNTLAGRDIVTGCKSSLDDWGKCKCWCKWEEWKHWPLIHDHDSWSLLVSPHGLIFWQDPAPPPDTRTPLQHPVSHPLVFIKIILWHKWVFLK